MIQRTRILIIVAITLAATALFGIILVVVLHGFKPESAALFTAWATIVGVVITQMVAAHLARTAQRQQQELEVNRAQSTSVQSYLEQMATLLIDHQLRNLDSNGRVDESSVVDQARNLIGSPPQNLIPREGASDARVVAQAQTLAILEGETDPTRKRIVLLFLYSSDLINRQNPILALARPDLREANLEGADLRGAYLYTANLNKANLRGTDLRGADLRGAALRGVHLSETSLYEANLTGVDLRGACLSEAYLTELNLVFASLSEADLSRAYLTRANLREANLSGAIMEGANLEGANLEGAILETARGLTQTQIEQANGDKYTKLPSNLQRPNAWSKNT